MSTVSYFPDQRRAAILEILSRGEAVSAAELAVRFSVSEDAIRRDLRKFAAEGLCEKVYGGALPIAPSAQPYAKRAKENVGRKQALAETALSLLKPRDCVFFDAGSTNVVVAECLPDNLELTIVTNSIPVMTVLMGRPGISLFALGGPINSQVGGVTGAKAVMDLQQYQFDLTFLGTCALCREKGVSAFDGEDAYVKRAAVENSNKIAVMATAEKLGTRLPHKVLDFDRIDHLIFEKDTAQQILRDFQTDSNQVLVAGKSGAQLAVDL
ncbi:MAG: DeoR/GlpR family DNA-binding transcription regulator [Roseibium sp.]|uniref:DeoR/GlpR family DNA-binding transcription regulator n=1 Tax=Roseibium sp. TaxID=1936156 RepID=UPI002636F3F5|nr:DeoR/GlpR family DNA-binding transcription regulator [Roseibium sp.]MCV0426097.1 DeoR/GlpR family DNA-binding transcription regulator [Roseibium sp.]